MAICRIITVSPLRGYGIFMGAKARVAERRICAEQEALFQQRLAEAREALEASAAVDAEVARHRLHIAEELLTLRCPRCRQAQ